MVQSIPGPISLLAAAALATGSARATMAQVPFDVVVEIPAGGSVKYEFDACAGRMRVDRFVQMPVAYPANYGFVAGTLGGDDDPLDALVYTREPLAPGAIVAARAIGVLRMTDAGEADEKVIAVPAAGVDAAYDAVGALDDLGPTAALRLERFFRVYKQLPEGAGPVVLDGFGDPVEAERMVEAARRAAAAAGAGAEPVCAE